MTEHLRDVYRDKLADLALALADLRGDLESARRFQHDAEDATEELRNQLDELTREREALLAEVAGLQRSAELDVTPAPDPPVESRPGKMGGAPCLTGTRITVDAVVALFRDRLFSIAQVALQYPSVSAAHIEAAIRWHMRQGKKRGRRS